MKIAIIGGSGFENPDLLKDQHEAKVETPFGEPSSTFKTGKIIITTLNLLLVILATIHWGRNSFFKF